MTLSKIQANMTENVLRTDVTDQVLNVGTVLENAGITDNFPIGMIVLFATDSQFGTGGVWLACDGAAYLKTAYPELFSFIGGEFGETLTTFSVPSITPPVDVIAASLGGGYGIRAKTGAKV
jgi:microcystin-dependent protein